MSDVIGGYRLLTAMQTTGSGSARWCMAMRGLERFFLKEFLSPVYPVNPDTPIGQKQQERCLRFEERKQRLYTSASCVLGDVLVPVVDFFREKGRYYAVTEAAPDGHMTAERAVYLPDEEKKQLLYDLAICLQRLHAQGIVHADLKPEHVLLVPQDRGWKPRLIDLDSGFLTEDPPQKPHELEGDPAYLAPEVFLKMAGEDAELDTALDVFAFGALISQIWTGSLPQFDRKKYHYLYEAALDGGEIQLDLPQGWEDVARRMLCAQKNGRPSDAEIAACFSLPRELERRSAAVNGLMQLMKLG